MKRILSLILAATLFVSIFTSCSLQHFTFNNDEIDEGEMSDTADNGGDNYITRKEWAEMLGVHFGMDTPTEESAYFADVDANDTYFPYIQSCAEWGVFDVSSNVFSPNAIASTDFAVSSAIVAAELNVEKETDSVAFARKNGLVIEENVFIDKSDAQNIITWSIEQQKNKPFVEYINNTFTKQVIDLSQNNTLGEIVCSGSEIKIDRTETNLSVGDVVIVYDANWYGMDVAKKIVDISVVDGQTILHTTEPEFEEVFDAIDFAVIAVPKIENIVPSQEGITIVEMAEITPTASNGMTAKVVSLSNTGKPKAVKLAKEKLPDFGVEINLTKGELVPNVDYFDWMNVEMSQGQLTDPTNEKVLWEEGTTVTDSWGNILYNNTQKYKSGYEITGSLKVSDIYIESTCKTKKVVGIPYAIERMENEVHFEVESYLSLKGSLEGEQEIFRTYVPIPGGAGLYVEVVFKLCVEANGELSVKSTIENTTTLTVTGKKIKKTNDTDASLDSSIQINVWAGIEATAELKLSWCADFCLVDVTAKAGCGMTMTATCHTGEDHNMVCLDATAYFPTLSISIGINSKSLVHKLGINAIFSVVDKEGALIKSFTTPICHYEISEDEKQFVKACTWKEKLKEDDPVSEGNENGELNYDSSSMMNISVYSLFLKCGEEQEIQVTAIPFGYEEKDICFYSQGNDIAMVKTFDGGTSCIVVGKSVGTTKIVIETKDGKHRFSCAVTVTESGIDSSNNGSGNSGGGGGGSF